MTPDGSAVLVLVVAVGAIGAFVDGAVDVPMDAVAVAGAAPGAGAGAVGGPATGTFAGAAVGGFAGGAPGGPAGGCDVGGACAPVVAVEPGCCAFCAGAGVGAGAVF